MQTSLPPSYDQLVQLYSACQSDKETLKEELAAAHAKLTKSEAVRKQLKEQLVGLSSARVLPQVLFTACTILLGLTFPCHCMLLSRMPADLEHCT